MLSSPWSFNALQDDKILAFSKTKVFADDKISASSKLKEFADDKSNVIQII